jgi:hypothetical protein
VTGPRSVAVVPSSLGLLPALGSPGDPLREVRGAALTATAWLQRRHPGDVAVLAADQRPDNVARGVAESPGLRVGRGLRSAEDDDATSRPTRALRPGEATTAAGLLVVANGSARRSEKAPGHLDERAFAFDGLIAAALRDGEPARLSALDPGLAEQLWCFDAPVWCHLGELDPRPEGPVVVDYDGDPFGVRYWVVRWTCGF